MRFNGKRYCLLIVLLGAALSACSGKPARELTYTEQLQQQVHEQQVQKVYTPAPVRVHVIQNGKAVLDKPLEIEVELYPETAAERVELILEPGPGLVLERRWYLLRDKLNRTEFTNVEKDKRLHHVISVIPREEGMLQLKAYVTLQQGQVMQIRIRDIPIALGNLQINTRSGTEQAP